jgi:hypothetical protein
MRKQMIDQEPDRPTSGEPGSWLDLDRLARVEITSQDACCPIESASFSPRASAGALRSLESR